MKAPVLVLLLLSAAAARAGLTGTAAPLALSPTVTVKTLPVICYHRFGEEDPFDDLKISPREFTDQLRWLKSAGYQSITLDQARDFLDGRGDSLPAKPVILSIDDGYRSGWTVAGPLMKRFGFKAVYFIIADQIAASSNFLNAKDIASLLEAGHEVGSHTSWHSNLGRPKRGETPAAYAVRLEYELVASRRKLEDRLGLSVTALAYPFGAYNPHVESQARKAGYDLIFSVSGGVNIPGDDRHRVRRILLAGRVNFNLFKKRVMERRLQASLEGMAEGMGLSSKELPHEILVRLPKDSQPRAELAGNPHKLEKVEGEEGLWKAVLARGMRPSYYYFKVETGSGWNVSRDSFLFQVYDRRWLDHFAALYMPLSPAASASLPLKSALPEDSPPEEYAK